MIVSLTPARLTSIDAGHGRAARGAQDSRSDRCRGPGTAFGVAHRREFSDTPRTRSSQEGGMRLEGKVALISGGAGGMGASEALIFAREGARVVVGDILEAEGLDTVSQITKARGQARFVKL